MKVVLVAPPVMDYLGDRLKPIAVDRIRECPPYGIYLLSNVLKSAGHDVMLVDLIAQGSQSLRRYRDDIADCGLVGIGATSFSWATARDVIKQVRQIREDVPIVLGGVHPTLFDRYILGRLPVQLIVRGEAEVALLALCDALEGRRSYRDVPNLSWRTPDGVNLSWNTADEIVHNPVRERIPAERLGTFPLPDYDALPSGIYSGLAIESSRGCAFDCSFCGTMYRKCWRGMSAGSFVDRLEAVMPHVGRTRHRLVQIVDDEFSTSPQRVIEIMDIVRRRGLSPRFVYNSRAPDLLSERYVESVAEFTSSFLVGAECGYDEGLARVGKGTTCDILGRAAKTLKLYGISDRSVFSFILGLPWETTDDIKKTVDFAMHLMCLYGVRVILQWYMLVPGSRLWHVERGKQTINESMYDSYGLFRNPYLFRQGNPLKPDEIWDLSARIQVLSWLAQAAFRDDEMISFAVPLAVTIHFPKEVLSDQASGLANLRELAEPGSGVRNAQ